MIEAVVFDLDGLLIDSEQVWDDVREALAHERGGRWHPGAQRDMMGMSSPEWSRYMHETIGLAREPRGDQPHRGRADGRALRGRAAVDRRARSTPCARRPALFTLGLASSSNRELIDLALEAGGIASLFRATVSSEEVARGKPAPDVYLEAARRLGVDPAACVAIEDSHNGIRSAKAAGMTCIAIPNPSFPPGDAVAEADVVLGSLAELTPETFTALAVLTAASQIRQSSSYALSPSSGAARVTTSTTSASVSLRPTAASAKRRTCTSGLTVSTPCRMSSDS